MRLVSLLLLFSILNTFVFPECCFSDEGKKSIEGDNLVEIKAVIDFFFESYQGTEDTSVPTKTTDALTDVLEFYQYLDYTFILPFAPVFNYITFWEQGFYEPSLSLYIVNKGLEIRPPKA